LSWTKAKIDFLSDPSCQLGQAKLVEAAMKDLLEDLLESYQQQYPEQFHHHRFPQLCHCHQGQEFFLLREIYS
jgi:hypothetical protein